MKTNITDILDRMRVSYEYEMGEYLEPSSRLRQKVELRNALVNAARPYGTMDQIAKMVGKADHSTAVYIIKEHDTYYNFSPQYRRNFSVAMEVVEKIARRHGLLPCINHKNGGSTTIEFELETVNKQIEALQKRRDTLLENLQERRKVSKFDNQQTI